MAIISRQKIAFILLNICVGNYVLSQNSCPDDNSINIYSTKQTVPYGIAFTAKDKTDGFWYVWKTIDASCQKISRRAFDYILDFDISGDTLFVINKKTINISGTDLVHSFLSASWWHINTNPDSIRTLPLTRVHNDRMDELHYIGVDQAGGGRKSYYLRADGNNIEVDFQLPSDSLKLYRISPDSIIIVKELVSGLMYIRKINSSQNLIPAGFTEIRRYNNTVIRTTSGANFNFHRFVNRDFVISSGDFTSPGDFSFNDDYALCAKGNDSVIVSATDLQDFTPANQPALSIKLNPGWPVRRNSESNVYYQQSSNLGWKRYSIHPGSPTTQLPMEKYVQLQPLGGKYILAQEQETDSVLLLVLKNGSFEPVNSQKRPAGIPPGQILLIRPILQPGDNSFVVLAQIKRKYYAYKLVIHSSSATIEKLDSEFIYDDPWLVRIDGEFLVTLHKQKPANGIVSINNYYKVVSLVTGKPVVKEDEKYVVMEAFFPIPGTTNQFSARAKKLDRKDYETITKNSN